MNKINGVFFSWLLATTSPVVLVMRKSTTILLLLACGLAFHGTQACAGPLDPLAADTTAIMHGSTSYLGLFNPFSGAYGGLVGSVDWAVYAPGTFPAGFAAGGYTPTPGDYVYTYQIHQDHGPLGDGNVTVLEVLLVNNTFLENIGDFTGSNTVGLVSGVMPDGSNVYQGAGMTWAFNGIPIPAGGTSDGLAFSSPYPPGLGSGVIGNNIAAAEVAVLPVPVPEPSSIALLAIGAIGLAAMARRRVT